VRLKTLCENCVLCHLYPSCRNCILRGPHVTPCQTPECCVGCGYVVDGECAIFKDRESDDISHGQRTGPPDPR